MKRDEIKTNAIKDLTRAIEAHESGDFLSMGNGYDNYDAILRRDQHSPDDVLFITLMFWDTWADTAEHTWKFYPPFTKDDWSKMARTLIEDLNADNKVTNETILSHFVQRPRTQRKGLGN